MERFSISQIAKLTGFDRRTVTARLNGQEGVQAGRAMLFTLRQFVDGVIAHQAERSDELNLEQERAKLAREQRQKLEREKAIAERKLLDADTALRCWSHVIVTMRQKVLNADLPEEVQADLIEELRDIPLEEYR